MLKSLSSLVFLLLLTACSGNAATEVPSTADAETVSPQVILEMALASTKEQLSYCFTYEYKAEVLNATRSHDSTGQRLRTPQEGIREDIESVTFGKYQAPSQFETTGSTTFATDNETITISRDAITIGVTVYTRIPPTSRVPRSGVRGRGSGERETTASSLAGKQQAREKEDNGGQGKDGPAGAIAQGGNGR